MHLASGEENFPEYPFKSGLSGCVLVCLRYTRLLVYLSAVICLHVDDMLGTGTYLFESKLKELDKLHGFGSMKRQKFVHCGRQYEKHASGKITISIEAFIQNLNKACLTRERMKQLDD